MQPEQGSVTLWITNLKAGELEAVRPLWERYFERLVGQARAKMAGLRDRSLGADDVAARAFDSFVRGAGRGRFPLLNDRDDLIRVLFLLALQKAEDLRRRERSLKHGGGNIVRGSEMVGEEDAFAEMMKNEPGPMDVDIFAEEVTNRLNALTEEERVIALLKLDGHTNGEIAEKIDKALATVERRLKSIRAKWEEAP